MRFAGAALGALALLAAAQEHEGLRRFLFAARVSGASPFAAGCSGTETGTLYPNAAVEPWVATDPRNPLRMVGAWQQDRWSNGAAAGLMAAVSLDGGESWRASLLPFTGCAGGNPRYARASDPWVSIAPDGTVFAIGLSLSASQVTQAVLVSRSADGVTWSAPVTLIEDSNRDVFDDKESLTADPTDARYVYAVWDRISGITTGPANYRGPSYFSRTTDGGATWEAPRAIFDPGANAQTIGNQIVVLPDGTLVNVFTWIQNATAPLVKNESLSAAVIRSTDKGMTWSAPVIVSDVKPVGVSDVKTGVPVRTGAGMPTAAVDAATGAVYVVWEDGRFSGGQREGIAMARSADGGLTWSAAEQVNQIPDVQAFTPAVAAQNGEVGVTYYDFRKDTSDPTVLMASYWRIVSRDGGQSWTEAPMAAPFDLTAAARTDSGYFLGDYQGLAAVNGRFFSFFVTSGGAPAGIPSSVYATWRPTGSDLTHNGRVEVNRYELRRHVEGAAARNNP